jgi:hypothetical protein
MTNKILCIPRIESTIKIDYIQKTIEKVNIGNIQKIVEIPHRNNPVYKRIIIYIQLNASSPNTKIIESRFCLKQDVKIIHQFPWYWKIVEASFIPQKK